MRTLEELRRELNQTDAQLRELLLSRLELSRQVAQVKRGSGAPVYVPEREQEILETLRRSCPKEDAGYLKMVVSSVLRTSRQRQYEYLLGEGMPLFYEPLEKSAAPISVCHQGVPGAYSQLAAEKLFPDLPLREVRTFEDVFRQVESGACDCGVLPLDNSTAGSVGETYDLLLKYGLYITDAYNLKITHCLAGTGTLREVEKICSHPQALAQCSEFLNTSGIPTEEVSNTAVAAQLAAQSGPGLAAISSPEAAALNGLQILRDDVQNSRENATRFVAIRRTLQNAPGGKVSIAFTTENQPGALVSVLEMFGGLELNVTKIQSRPVPDRRWEYRFYLDFDGDLGEERTRCVLLQLSAEVPSLRLLGNYRERLS